MYYSNSTSWKNPDRQKADLIDALCRSSGIFVFPNEHRKVISSKSHQISATYVMGCLNFPYLNTTNLTKKQLFLATGFHQGKNVFYQLVKNYCSTSKNGFQNVSACSVFYPWDETLLRWSTIIRERNPAFNYYEQRLFSQTKTLRRSWKNVQP
jgi:hypothetical protein